MSGKSRIEKIIENLLGGDNVIELPIGRDEKILYSILNDTEYTEPPHSIFEDLLLAIKTGNVPRTTYVYNNLSRDEKILFCKINRLEYFEPPHSRLEKLLIKWLYLDLYLNIDGVPPFTFISNGSPLINYLIEGNTVQSGTPTPDNPIMPEGCGELEAGQYKIPISSANTTTPVYLGEVQTTRRVKKLVLTGDEANWSATYWSNSFVFFDTISTTLPQPVSDIGICSHFQQRYVYVLSAGEFNVRFTPETNRIVVGFGKSGFATIGDFKTYLAAQYAAGTPVTVWYVLAKPETGIVNEPLMKIGDYADEINYEQTVVSIPTVSGRNTFDVLGDVKPSNVEITYAPRAPLLRTRKTILKK